MNQVVWMPRPVSVTSPFAFIKNVGFTELEMDLSAYLVIADTGVYGHTREAIQVVQKQGQGCPARFCMPWEN